MFDLQKYYIDPHTCKELGLFQDITYIIQGIKKYENDPKKANKLFYMIMYIMYCNGLNDWLSHVYHTWRIRKRMK